MTAINKEVWKAIPGFEGLYEVSSRGRIRGCERIQWVKNRKNVVRRVIPPRDLGQRKDALGRMRTILHRNSKPHQFLVHRLVLAAFVGPQPENMECCHYNGIPTDNRIENLRWDTREANRADLARHIRERQEARA